MRTQNSYYVAEGGKGGEFCIISMTSLHPPNGLKFKMKNFTNDAEFYV